MAKCNDCWCEQYDQTQGNCDLCVKSMCEVESPELREILKRRIVKQVVVDKPFKVKGQSR